MNDSFQSITWQDAQLTILDQTYLPDREIYTRLDSAGQVWEAIRKLRVRGAPAIGIAAAYGLYLGLLEAFQNRIGARPAGAGNPSFSGSSAELLLEAKRISTYLASSRPTAVNLAWALERINRTLYAHRESPPDRLLEMALETAITIHTEDARLCKQIGEHGLEVIPENARILTHCNTGALATAAWGTALSVIRHAWMAGRLQQAWVDETRPLLQGSRLTAWELKKEKIPFRLITDSTAGFLMQQKRVDLIVTGADRIAANGDTANKIGTYTLAVLAKAHEVPFYIAAPYSTIDLQTPDGGAIPIEERDPEEITRMAGTSIAPNYTEVYNPAFDITPHKLITGFITEKGIIRANYSKNLLVFRS